MHGDAGNDKFFAQDAAADVIDGGTGTDVIGNKDAIDTVTGIP